MSTNKERLVVVVLSAEQLTFATFQTFPSDFKDKEELHTNLKKTNYVGELVKLIDAADVEYIWTEDSMDKKKADIKEKEVYEQFLEKGYIYLGTKFKEKTKPLIEGFTSHKSNEPESNQEKKFDNEIKSSYAVSDKLNETHQPDQTDMVTCIGYYSNKKICTTEDSPLVTNLIDSYWRSLSIPTIIIDSYWRNLTIPNNTYIIFEYDPSTEIAYNVRIYPNSLEIIKSENKVVVKGGTLQEGDYYLTNQGLILKGKTEIACLYGSKISLITEERAKHLMKSVALGAAGALATFGVGVVVGILHASKKYQLIEVRFSETEFFIAECRPDAYQQLLTATIADNPVIKQNDFLDSIKNGQEVDDIIKYFASVKKDKKIAKYAGWSILVIMLFIGIIGKGR